MRKSKPWPHASRERLLFESGAKTIVGIDEVGKGSWAGPLVIGIAMLSREMVFLMSLRLRWVVCATRSNFLSCSAKIFLIKLLHGARDGRLALRVRSSVTNSAWLRRNVWLRLADSPRCRLQVSTWQLLTADGTSFHRMHEKCWSKSKQMLIVYRLLQHQFWQKFRVIA